MNPEDLPELNDMVCMTTTELNMMCLHAPLGRLWM